MQKPFFRLWLPDQTPETVAEALAEMKDEAEYQNLANEGFARTYIDWLYGVNLTRYATLKTGVLLRVGRVIVPIIKAIYDRDRSIEHFVPEKYYAVISRAQTKGAEIELVSKERFAAAAYDKALAYAAKLNGCKAVVAEKKKRKGRAAPGKAFFPLKAAKSSGQKI